MNSFELDIGEKSRVGSRFISRVRSELQRALATEKASRKITQQAIAEKIGTDRSVINRQIQGLENLTLRRVAELLWAVGWEPKFEANKIPDRDNYFTPNTTIKPLTSIATSGSLRLSELQIKQVPNGMKLDQMPTAAR